MSLNKYINELDRKVQRLSDYQLAECIAIDSEIKIDQTAIANIKIILIDYSELYIKEYVNGKYGINRIDYSYQYQSVDKSLIFRYDNSKHKPPLGCSDHKHQKDGSIIPCQMPTIDDIIEEVIDYLTTNI
jgi:hypothetical protein